MKIYNLDKYETLLTNPKSIYLLGLLWSDGYFGGTREKNYSICLRLQIEDFVLIEPLMTSEWGNWRIFNYKKPIDHPTWKQMRQGMIGSRELCLFLEKYDFHLKSKIGPKRLLEKIPENLRHYFLRGYSDGDGCFYIRKTKQFTYSISGPYDFNWDFINLFPVQFRIIRLNYKNKASNILIEKIENIIKIGEYMYQGEKFGLERKYKKFLQIKQIIKDKKEAKDRPYYRIKVISPNGKKRVINDIKTFCLKFDLNENELTKLVNKEILFYEGWILHETLKPKKLYVRKGAGKDYLFMFEGKIVKIKNLSKFCRDNHLSRGSLKSVVAGIMESHKGYSLYKEEFAIPPY